MVCPLFSCTFQYPYNLGRAHYDLGEYAQAERALREAVYRNDSAVMPHLYLAATYVRLNQQDDAEWEIEQVRVIEPNVSLTHVASRAPFGDEAMRDRLLADLRHAGLPE